MSYFSTLHKRSDDYKKRFALTVSGFVTLFIFAVWSLATFGGKETVANLDLQKNEVSPFASFKQNFAASFAALKESFVNLNNASSELYGR